MVRELLLQVKRQLENCSVEAAAARQAIERETITDMEQIIERLRAVESLRQSSIKHQVSRDFYVYLCVYVLILACYVINMVCICMNRKDSSTGGGA